MDVNTQPRTLPAALRRPDEGRLMRTRQPTPSPRLGPVQRSPLRSAALLLLACGLLSLSAATAGAQVRSPDATKALLVFTGGGTATVEEGELLTLEVTATPGNFTPTSIDTHPEGGPLAFGFFFHPPTSDGSLLTSLTYPAQRRSPRGSPMGTETYVFVNENPIPSGLLLPTDTADPTFFSVVVLTAENARPEGDRTIRISLVSGAGAVLVLGADQMVTVTIREDDVGIAVSADRDAVPEDSTATFTFTRSGVLDRAVTVGYSVGGAVQDGDYDDPEGGEITIPANASSATVDIGIVDDGFTGEPRETLEVTIDSVAFTDGTVTTPISGTVSGLGTSAQVTAIEPILLRVEPVEVSTSLPEGGVFRFRIVASRAATQEEPISGTYRTRTGTASSADFTPTPEGGTPFAIPRGAERTGVFELQLADDSQVEADTESFTIEFEATTPADAVVRPASIAIAIEENDLRLTLSGPPEVQTNIAEAGGGVATFTVTRRGATRPAVTIPYVVSGVEAGAFRHASDVAVDPNNPLRGSVLLGPGQASASFALTLLENAEAEGDRTLRVALATEVPEIGGTVTIAPAEADSPPELTIVDDDLGIVVGAPSGPAVEGSTAVFTVTRRGDLRPEVELTYRVGGEGIDAADYEDVTDTDRLGRIALEAGQASAEIRLRIADEGIAEEDEVLRVTVEAFAPPALSPGGTFALLTASAAVTIRDDAARQEARRERRTRAMLASTHRATAQLATDIISNRFPRGDVNKLDANAGREPAPDALRHAGTGPDVAAEEGRTLATDALGTALRLTGLPAGPTHSAGTDAAMPNPESATLLAGIDVPVRPFETGPREASYGAGSGVRDRDVDPRLPSFAELLRGGHQFELSGEQLDWGGLGEGLAVWGAGAFQSLEGDPELNGRRLDYDGESYGVFLGADKRLALSGDASELVAGAAFGWTRSDLDYRDEALQAFELAGRFENELWSIHPYAALRLSPRAQLWLIGGYGWGDVEIEEREERAAGETTRRRVETDATLWMVSAGAEGSVPLGSEASLLTARVQGTRTGGDLDRASFDDGAQLRRTRARTWRVAGELEASHRFASAEGESFRPYGTVRVRGDAGDDLGEDWELAVDLGGGAELSWPQWGVSFGFEAMFQVNEGAGRKEHQVTVDLSYDLGGDGRGVTVAMASALEGSGRFGDRVDSPSGLAAGNAFAPDPYGPGGTSFGALLPGGAGSDYATDREWGALRHSLQGEIGYGLGVRPSWSPGLLTPYARFELAGGGDSAYATGLRFEAEGGARLGLELGVDFDRRAIPPSANFPSYQFKLMGELEF